MTHWGLKDSTGSMAMMETRDLRAKTDWTDWKAKKVTTGTTDLTDSTATTRIPKRSTRIWQNRNSFATRPAWVRTADESLVRLELLAGPLGQTRAAKTLADAAEADDRADVS